jgi:hypothetical protein
MRGGATLVEPVMDAQEVRVIQRLNGPSCNRVPVRPTNQRRRRAVRVLSSRSGQFDEGFAWSRAKAFGFAIA